MINVAQCRAARALLDWSAEDLAGAAAVGVATVRRFESGHAVASTSLEKIAATFREAGVRLIEDGEVSKEGGRGVRLDSPG